jgi:hypothetical protein
MSSVIEQQMEFVSNKNIIPPMTDPLGRYWEQPNRSEIRVDECFAYMNYKTFKALANYSNSRPTGAYEGKMWRAHYLNDGWCLCWFGLSKPGFVSNNSRIIKITMGMTKNPGKIVSWIDNNNKEQKGIAYNNKQSKQLSGRIMIHRVDKDFNPLLDDNKKQFVTLKSPDKLKLIGYVD